MRVLVVNAGSSSVKLRLLDADDAIEHSADLCAGPDGFDAEQLADVLRNWREPDAVGHRTLVITAREDLEIARQTRQLRDARTNPDRRAQHGR
jgi:acetate kinase